MHALDGYDEVSLTDGVSVRRRRRQAVLYPEDFSLSRLTADSLYGGETAAEGKAIFLSVLAGTATPAQEAVVCANAGLAIRVMRPERSLPDCVAEARESLRSGRARDVLHKLLG